MIEPKHKHNLPSELNIKPINHKPMKYYFVKLTLNQPKNKAQEAAQAFAETYKDCLFDKDKLEEFCEKIVPETIKKINEQHSRSANLEISLHPLWRDESELELHIDGGIFFSIRSVKRMENNLK